MPVGGFRRSVSHNAFLLCLMLSSQDMRRTTCGLMADAQAAFQEALPGPRASGHIREHLAAVQGKVASEQKGSHHPHHGELHE